MLLHFYIGKAAIPILWKFLNRWPNPDAARKGDWQAMARLLTPLGLHEKRAKIIIRFSGNSLYLDLLLLLIWPTSISVFDKSLRLTSICLTEFSSTSDIPLSCKLGTNKHVFNCSITCTYFSPCTLLELRLD